jgi:hypothetical protein
MSFVTNPKAYLVALAAAVVGGSDAFANEPLHVYQGPIEIGHGNPNAAACAAGFTANPSTIQGSNPYDQSYTCTGPTIVCSAHFSPEDSVAGTVPAAPGQLLGQTIYGSPVTLSHGRMVYTCVEPPSPPK